MLLHAALRLSELVALDVDDVRLSARKALVVRSGKGDAFREVPLNASARAALEASLTARPAMATEGERGLLVGRQGQRIIPRAVDLVVRKVAAAAGLQLSAHVLRHTCITKLVRNGNDNVMVAEPRRPPTPRNHTLLQPPPLTQTFTGDGRPRGSKLVTSSA